MNKTNDYFRHRLHDLLMLDENFRVGLARQLRVPVQTVCDWESGADIPNVYQFREIADCFELPYAWFLDGTDGIPDMTELAEQLGISRDELQDLERQVSIATVIPLDDYLRADAQASDDAGPSTRLEKQEEKKLLAEGIEQLPPKEKQVVTLYYYEEMTLKEISLVMHLSEARISQLHTKAVFRLRAYMARD